MCNARVSDWIGEAPLLRIDPVHHRIALFPSKRNGVQHINHQVESIDDIMRSYYFLREKNVKIRFGPGRHPTSGAMFLYFDGPDGMIYEYSSGVRLITDEAGYRPRQFPATSTSYCAWGSKPDIPEFARAGREQWLIRLDSTSPRKRDSCGSRRARSRARGSFTHTVIAVCGSTPSNFLVSPPKPLGLVAAGRRAGRGSDEWAAPGKRAR